MRLDPRLFKTAATSAAVVAACVCIFFADPHRFKYYAPCVFHEITGLHCPGCGATRAVYHLLHGRLREACARNVMLVVLLPMLMVMAIGRLLEQYGVVKLPLLPAWAIWVLVTVIATYAVARNLPWRPFCLLAPQ